MRTEILRVTTGETVLMRWADITVFDLESGDYVPISSPDSVTFNWCEVDSDAPQAIAGNQEGSTNSWNAVKTTDAAGTFKWWCVVVKAGKVGISKPGTAIVSDP